MEIIHIAGKSPRAGTGQGTLNNPFKTQKKADSATLYLGSMLSASLHIKLIADTYYRLYVSWFFAVWFNLFTQVVYYIYHA